MTVNISCFPVCNTLVFDMYYIGITEFLFGITTFYMFLT